MQVWRSETGRNSKLLTKLWDALCTCGITPKSFRFTTFVWYVFELRKHFVEGIKVIETENPLLQGLVAVTINFMFTTEERYTGYLAINSTMEEEDTIRRVKLRFEETVKYLPVERRFRENLILQIAILVTVSN